MVKHLPTRTQAFDRMWLAAYDRDAPLLEEAARLAAGFPELAGDALELAELAGTFHAAGLEFEAAVAAVRSNRPESPPPE